MFDTDGARLGSLTAVEEGVRGMYYVVTGGEKGYRIPVVDEFVKRVSLTDGVVVALIDGWSCERAAASFQSKGGAVL